MLYNFAQLYTIFVYAVPFDITLSHFTQRYTICVYAVPFDNTLSHFTQRYTVCMYAIPFYITLSYFTQRYTVCAYAVLLDNLCHLTQRNTVCVLYYRGVKLFAIEPVHFTISCSNSTWTTRPFIIWLNHPCFWGVLFHEGKLTVYNLAMPFLY